MTSAAQQAVLYLQVCTLQHQYHATGTYCCDAGRTAETVCALAYSQVIQQGVSSTRARSTHHLGLIQHLLCSRLRQPLSFGPLALSIFLKTLRRASSWRWRVLLGAACMPLGACMDSGA